MTFRERETNFHMQGKRNALIHAGKERYTVKCTELEVQSDAVIEYSSHATLWITDFKNVCETPTGLRRIKGIISPNLYKYLSSSISGNKTCLYDLFGKKS